jgi:heme-degrading monooxygenase HmoA
MIAMIFEYWIDPQRPDLYREYLAESASIRELLPGLTGFHGIERFESSSEEGKFVSLAFFDDEEAVARWRTTPQHRRVQALGRSRLFTQYRLRMADVTRDYGGHNRDQAPADSRAVHG